MVGRRTRIRASRIWHRWECVKAVTSKGKVQKSVGRWENAMILIFCRTVSMCEMKGREIVPETFAKSRITLIRFKCKLHDTAHTSILTGHAGTRPKPADCMIYIPR